MSWPHLFEFMDQEWLPSSLRNVLREILEVGCSRPFRPYYEWVAQEVLQAAKQAGCRRVVELGAGEAPVTKVMAPDPASDGLELVVSDYNPDRKEYEALEKRWPGKVVARYDRVDFSVPQRWEPGTLLFLSAALHHLPPALRPQVLKSLTASARPVMVFEPLRRTPLSVLFVLPSLVPALLLPLWLLKRPGRGWRFLWCWLLPVAPLLFWWDGCVSCLRMWPDAEWRRQLAGLLGPDRPAEVRHWTFCQLVRW